MKKSKVFAMTPTQISILEAQDFKSLAPGTILPDFEALLGLIGDHGIPVTPTHLFAMKSLETINQTLTHPLELRLKRALQKSYPPINGLYLLLRASGIARIETQPKKPLLKLDPTVLESWRSLNGVERYFALLEAWWGRASEEIIQERGGWATDIFQKNLLFLKRFPKTGILTLQRPQDTDMLRYLPGLYNLALMELFGLVEMRAMSPVQANGWLPEEIRMLDLGRVLLGSYADFIQRSLAFDADHLLPMPASTEGGRPLEYFEQWSQAVRPHIKAWQKDLDIPAPVFQPGPHLFKISLGTRCWRRIAIGGESSLDTLAGAILDAFDFDSDHLYRFSYKDRFGRTIGIDHPYMTGDSDNSLTDSVRVGDIPLSNNMNMVFLYDFGDEWEFDIQTEGVNTGPKIRKPRLLEKYGKAPEQYGDEY